MNAFTTSVAAAVLGIVATHSSATVLVSEAFDYPNSNLAGKDPPTGGPWGTHSGTAGPIKVTGGQAVLVQTSPDVDQDVRVLFQDGFEASTDVVLYAGFDLTVPETTSSITSGFFAHFSTNDTNFDGRVWITAPTTSGYRLALSNDTSITDGDGEIFSTDLSFDTTYRVIVRYSFNAATAALWIDPVNEASASFAASDPGFSRAVDAFALRQFSPADTGGSTQLIDNLVVATTFNQALAIPEPTVLTVLTCSAAAVALRRQRRSRK